MNRRSSSEKTVASALSGMTAHDVGGETYRAVAMVLDRVLPSALSAIPPASPLAKVVEEFRRWTPIAEELPLFAFVALTAQYLGEQGVRIMIPDGRACMDLYTVIGAGSGELKTFAPNRILESISPLWVPRSIKEPGSARGLLDAVKANDGKAALWICDEWGKFWEQTKAATGPHAETPRMILKFYDKTSYSKNLKNELVEVRAP